MKLFGIDINTGFLFISMQAIAQASGLSPMHVGSKNNQPKTESLETPDSQQCRPPLSVFAEWQHTPQNCDMPPMFIPHFDSLRKFPDDIRGEPYFEGSGKSRTKAEENDFISRQKNEFLEALKYTEDHILSRSDEEWTSETVLKDITDLNQILGKTLRVHRLSSTSSKISKEGYRLKDVVSYRPCPLSEYSAQFDIQNPGNVFKCLSASDKSVTAGKNTNDIFASATDFLKWYLKWDKQYDSSFQELEDTVKNVIKTYGGDVKQWRNTHFSGKSLSAWHHDFFENEGKSFKFPEDITGIIKTSLTRHTAKGLYTPQELKVVDRVIKFFLPPQEVPQAMREMANKVVKMIQEKAKPIDIASYVRYAITHEIHPFPNGNGRTASIYINSILMRFGYPAIPRQTRDIRKSDVLEVRNAPNRYVLYREKLRKRLHDRCQQNPAPACEALRTKKRRYNFAPN